VAGTAVPVAAVLKLADGRPVQGATVTWTPTSGTIAPETSQTDASGRASAQWTLGSTAGAQGASAAVAGVAPASFSATATSTGVVASARVVTPQTSAPTGSTLTVTAQLLDVHGNPVAGAPAAWSITVAKVLRISDGLPVAGTEAWWFPIGNGSVSPTSAVSDANGMVSTRLTLGTNIGLNGVTVSAPGANPAWSSYIADFTGTGPMIMPTGCTFIPNTNDGNTATAFSVSCSSGVLHTYPLTSSPKVYLADNVGSITASMGIGGVAAAGLVPGTIYPARVVAVDVNGNQGVTYTGALFPTAK
jgi:hypothetical protein